jgi:hypothetical protein
MAYSTAVLMQKSESLKKRVIAAVAAENFTPAPEQWTTDQFWFLVASTEWQTKWADALKQSDNTKINPDIGARDDVITDLMILAAVQGRKNYLESQEPEVTP